MVLSSKQEHQYLSANQASGQLVTQPKRKRLAWLDIAKGIGMIAVVCGHNMPDYILHVRENRYWYDFLYWWHMPLFFLIAGFFVRPIDLRDIQKVIAFFKKRVSPVLRSYFVAGILLIIAYKFIHNKSITYSAIYFLDLFYGGQTLAHYTTIFWYPETYILGIIGTTVIISVIKFKPLQLLIAAYFIYWSTSYTQITAFKFFGVVTAPWDMDVAVLVMAYMLIGYNLFYFGQHYLTKWVIFLPSAAAVGWLFIQRKELNFSFGLFMRSHQFSGIYHNVIVSHSQLALMVGIIPILCCFTVFGFSKMIAYPLKLSLSSATVLFWPLRFVARILQVTGKHTLIIMYMHKLILDIVSRLQLTESFWLQVGIATLVPLLIGVGFRHFNCGELINAQLTRLKGALPIKKQESNKL